MLARHQVHDRRARAAAAVAGAAQLLERVLAPLVRAVVAGSPCADHSPCQGALVMRTVPIIWYTARQWSPSPPHSSCPTSSAGSPRSCCSRPARACSAAGSCCAASPSTRMRSGPRRFPGLVAGRRARLRRPARRARGRGRVRRRWSSRSAAGERLGPDVATALGLTGMLALGVILASDVFAVRVRASSRCCSAACCWSSRATSRSPAAASAAAVAASLRAAGGRGWRAGSTPPRRGALGVRSRAFDAVLLALVALVVIAALSALGALLVGALVVVPAATVRLWTSRLPSWQAATVALVAVEGTAGLWLSVKLNAPPGATIATLSGAVFAVRGARARGRPARAPRGGGRGGRRRAGRWSRWRAAATATPTGRASSPPRPSSATGRAQLGGERLRRAPDPAAEHRPARLRAASRRRRGARAAPTSILRSGGDLDALGRGCARRRRRRCGRRRRRRGARDRAATSPASPTRTGGTTPRNAELRRRARSATRSRGSPRTRTATVERAQARYVRALRAPRRGRSPACIAAVPRAQRKLVTDHDALGYFAARYDIDVVGAAIPARTTVGAAVRGRARRARRHDRARARAGRVPGELGQPEARRDARARDRRDRALRAVRRHARAGRLERRHLSEDGAANADAMVRGFTGRQARMPELDAIHAADARELVAARGLAAGYGGSPAIEDVTLRRSSAGCASACSAPTAAARRRSSARCSASCRRSAGTLPVDGALRHRPADRALAPRLPGERARRRADGHAAAAAVVARPGRAERRAGARGARARWGWPTWRARPSASCPAASASACWSRARSCRTPTCCCSTSPSPALDEPSAARLDGADRRARRARGARVMVATHDMEQTRAWDRVLCLNRRQVAFGPPRRRLTREVLERTYGGAIVMLPGDGERRGRRSRRTTTTTTSRRDAPLADVADALLDPWRSGDLGARAGRGRAAGARRRARSAAGSCCYGLSYSAESLAHALFPGLVIAALAGFPLRARRSAGARRRGARDRATRPALPEIGARHRGRGGRHVAASGCGALLALSPDTPRRRAGAAVRRRARASPTATSRSPAALARAGARRAAAAARAPARSRASTASNAPRVRRRPRGRTSSLLLLVGAFTVVAVQALGSLLVLALLVGPAATARAACRGGWSR